MEVETWSWPVGPFWHNKPFSDPSVPRAFGRRCSSDWWSYSYYGDLLRKTQSDPKNKSRLFRTFIVCFSTGAGIWIRPPISHWSVVAEQTQTSGCGGVPALQRVWNVWTWSRNRGGRFPGKINKCGWGHIEGWKSPRSGFSFHMWNRSDGFRSVWGSKSNSTWSFEHDFNISCWISFAQTSFNNLI